MQTEESHDDKTIQQFSRYAQQYNNYNSIQSEVAKKLLGYLSTKNYEYVLDIGCGSGEVYRHLETNNISIKNFLALDSSLEMLSLHPSNLNVEKYQLDFNMRQCYEKLNVPYKTTQIIASSSLQWSKDLEFTFSHLSRLSDKSLFAIFTANTFKTLHKTAKIKSPIYTEADLKKIINKYYKASFSVVNYRLEFMSVREMFKYIKRSGVSGGEKKLNYRQTKELMHKYPLSYLEFEVLFVEATSLTKCK